MRTFTAPLYELGEFEEITKLLKKQRAMAALTGCVDSQKLHMVYGLSDGFKYKIIVTFSDSRARDIYEDYQLYDKNVMVYPAKDLIFYQADIHGNQLVKERVKVLRRMMEGRPLTVINNESKSTWYQDSRFRTSGRRGYCPYGVLQRRYYSASDAES